MAKNVRRKVVLSVITLCFFLVLLAGSTYALFSDDAPVNITVSSAKVDLEAKILDDYTLSSASGEIQKEQGKPYAFELGGTAELNDKGELILTNIAPGDKITFKSELTNNSNITILQRIRLVDVTEGEHSTDKCLLTGNTPLVVTINGIDDVKNPYHESYNEQTKTAYVTDWALVNPSNEPTTITVSIELPVNAGNEYQDLTCKLQIIVDAYQGNADSNPDWDETIVPSRDAK